MDGLGESADLQSQVCNQNKTIQKCLIQSNPRLPLSTLLFSVHSFLIHRSLVDLEGAQMVQESLAIEAMIFDNDQGFFGGL